ARTRARDERDEEDGSSHSGTYAPGHGDLPLAGTSSSERTYAHAVKPKPIKTPFTVDPRLRATGQIVVETASTMDLASDGTLAIAARTPVFMRDNATLPTPGDLAGAEAEHVAWSPDGSRIAIVGFEWIAND